MLPSFSHAAVRPSYIDPALNLGQCPAVVILYGGRVYRMCNYEFEDYSNSNLTPPSRISAAIGSAESEFDPHGMYLQR